MRGLVIKNTGSWYQVKTEDGKLVDCKIKGNFRLKGIRSTNPIAVGDYVQIIVNNEGTAFISERRPQELHHPTRIQPIETIAYTGR